MTGKLGKDEILDHIIEAAVVKWGRAIVEEVRPAFETAAEAISKVEQFQSEAEEEPALLTMILQRESLSRRMVK